MNVPCRHCGEKCPPDPITVQGENFCCQGCSVVFSILSENNLLDFYTHNENAGLKQNTGSSENYSHLDEPSVAASIVDFQNDKVVRVRLHLPTIHCSSCLWLLENLHRIEPAIVHVNVLFGSKEAQITYRADRLSLRTLSELLARIGYPPTFNRTSSDRVGRDDPNRGLIIRVGIVGFLFGNIMLMSFPEYLTHDAEVLGKYGKAFAWINLILAIPVIVVGARQYFVSAWKGLRMRRLNIDVPIAIGISAIFVRSVIEIVSGSGPGYLDSMAGLVFFLLVGRWFQGRMHHQLSFDHDHRSYFPLAVTRISEEGEQSILINELEIGDLIRVRTGEIIPADSLLLSSVGYIDNSFITGESDENVYTKDQRVYAGGKNGGGALKLQVMKKVDQSYLTSLWNSSAFQKQKNELGSMVDIAARYFTPTILLISITTLVYWYFHDPSLMWHAFSAVLIIACPCALALTIPFTLGHARYILGRAGLYARNVSTLENLSQVRDFVLDKTGTLTESSSAELEFVGDDLSRIERFALQKLAAQSSHPVSRAIAGALQPGDIILEEVRELAGAGIMGKADDMELRLGSSEFTNNQNPVGLTDGGTWVSINGARRGYFLVKKKLRANIPDLINELKAIGDLHLISGDNEEQASEMENLLGAQAIMRFNQKPEDKMVYIGSLQGQGCKVAMIGDGLNDAGAFKQSDVGIAIVDDVHGFSPACDLILRADSLVLLSNAISYVKRCMDVVRMSILLSFAYNVVGILFAVQGLLSPVVAAVLMPLSSISIMAIGTTGSQLIAGKMGLLKNDSGGNISVSKEPERSKSPALI